MVRRGFFYNFHRHHFTWMDFLSTKALRRSSTHPMQAISSNIAALKASNPLTGVTSCSSSSTRISASTSRICSRSDGFTRKDECVVDNINWLDKCVIGSRNFNSFFFEIWPSAKLHRDWHFLQSTFLKKGSNFNHFWLLAWLFPWVPPSFDRYWAPCPSWLRGWFRPPALCPLHLVSIA